MSRSIFSLDPSARAAKPWPNCLRALDSKKATALLYSVVTGLHASLIPIISYQSGVDVGEFGLILKSSSIEEIKDSIRMVSDLPAQELKLRARKAWEFARKNHTREKFADEYRKAVENIISSFQRD